MTDDIENLPVCEWYAFNTGRYFRAATETEVKYALAHPQHASFVVDGVECKLREVLGDWL